MILVPAQRASLALNATKCARPDGSGDEAFLEQLRLLTPRVAGMLNCATLARGTYRDTFMTGLYRMFQSPGVAKLRLANGFIAQGTAITVDGLFDGSGAVAAPEMIDLTNGVLYIPYDYAEKYVKVTYTSGFAVPEDTGADDDVHPDPEYRVGQNVPVALEGIVVDALIHLRRTAVLSLPKGAVPETISLGDLNEALLRDLKQRIVNWYDRPRNGMVFYDMTEVAP